MRIFEENVNELFLLNILIGINKLYELWEKIKGFERFLVGLVRWDIDGVGLMVVIKK